MNLVKKLLTAVIALVMMLGMSIRAMAEDPSEGETPATPDGSITVSNTHKGQIYELYRLFDATTVEGREDGQTGISYRLMDGKSDFKVTVDGVEIDGATWFTLDAGGNVVIKDQEAFAAITDDNAEFAKWAKAYGNPYAPITADVDNAEVKWTDLPEGYYFITTTTGSLVSVDSIKPDVTVQDKNPVTEVDKKVTGEIAIDETGEQALAQIGTVVDYEVRIPISRGAYNYTFTDTMTSGLTLNGNSVQVYIVDHNAEVAQDDVAEEEYGVLVAENQTEDSIPDILIEFDDEWLKVNWGKDIVIRYSATINKDAVIVDPNNNTARIEYGNEDNPLTNEDEVEVYTARVTVIKTDGNDEPLSGAGFILKNAENKYYKLVEGIVTWVENEADADVIMVSEVQITDDPATEDVVESGTSMQAVFNGLGPGVYTLIEKVVPAGYNQAKDEVITITGDSVQVANIDQTMTIINQSGSELPSTGGMGTTIFYTLGGMLVLCAGILLVSRRRMSE